MNETSGKARMNTQKYNLTDVEEHFPEAHRYLPKRYKNSKTVFEYLPVDDTLYATNPKQETISFDVVSGLGWFDGMGYALTE